MISQENNSWKALLKSYYCKGLFHIVGGSLGHEKQYQWIIFDHDIAEILSFEINYNARRAQRPTSSLYLHFNKNYTNYMSLYA